MIKKEEIERTFLYKSGSSTPYLDLLVKNTVAQAESASSESGDPAEYFARVSEDESAVLISGTADNSLPLSRLSQVQATPVTMVYKKVTTSVETYYTTSGAEYSEIEGLRSAVPNEINDGRAAVKMIPLHSAVAFASKIAFIVSVFLFLVQTASGVMFLHPILAIFIALTSVAFFAMAKVDPKNE